MNVRLIQVGSNLNVIVGATTNETNTLAAKVVARAHASGESAIENGVTTWVEFNEIVDTTKSGSDVYTWRGDKVKCNKVLVTKDANGDVTRKVIGTTWRAL